MILNELFLEFNKSKGVVSVDGISLGVLIHSRAIEIKDLLRQDDEVDWVLMLFVLKPLNFSDFLKTITQDFKLQLVLQMSNGNVCFMLQNEELRDDFKVVFYVLDVVDYVYALLYSTKYSSLNKKNISCVDAPKTIAQFWKLVRLGTFIREAFYGNSDSNVFEKKMILETLVHKVDVELE